MNLKFQRINIENTLFIDIENVRRSKELIVDSTEYDLYQKKRRNRETDEFLTDEELKKDYEKRGALVMGFSTIVTIGVGFVKEGIPYIKSIVGTEEEIIKELCKITNSFSYVCGYNIIGYDLPLIVNNGWRYFNVAKALPDRFITSGKKPWNLESCIDLLDVYRGTHYANSSLEEVCYHFDIPTPKDGISGADVSRVYYKEGIDRISEYVKKDVLANINIFLKMQGKQIYKDFVDRSDVKIEDNRTLLEKLHMEGVITPEMEKELIELTKENKPTEKDWGNIQRILEGVHSNDDFINKNQDTKKVREEKEIEIENLIEKLKNG